MNKLFTIFLILFILGPSMSSYAMITLFEQEPSYSLTNNVDTFESRLDMASRETAERVANVSDRVYYLATYSADEVSYRCCLAVNKCSYKNNVRKLPPFVVSLFIHPELEIVPEDCIMSLENAYKKS
ncbi:MAG: hypothetical protein SFU27_00005, partial [Thermonemataceae bacterium]|nr:hypothetical protein [Thermonemataceae bacterium]